MNGRKRQQKNQKQQYQGLLTWCFGSFISSNLNSIVLKWVVANSSATTCIVFVPVNSVLLTWNKLLIVVGTREERNSVLNWSERTKVFVVWHLLDGLLHTFNSAMFFLLPNQNLKIARGAHLKKNKCWGLTQHTLLDSLTQTEIGNSW